ncbi:hypothetical protein Naga_100081g23 [Nannochloropsis gaditana]|uniref:Uncharacterized protein n=1 Tax=Nannochloropsis gaditana TaxID=72520 RepID=W7T1U1_9STRA|nr:hypothetical protein Naga_100081g23 [Nannochloropsis gaditana]
MRREVDDSLRGEENWDHPASMNAMCRRTLKIEYWDRSRECKERKWDHMDYIDATYASREEWILQSVLPRDEIVLEENKFPYNTPKGIRHMTLWARRELSLEEVESYMIDWIERERPGVRRWNLDENASRSIQVYHVHIYTQEVPDEEVGPSPSRGDAEDLDDHILSEDAKNGEESDPDDDLEHRSRPRHKAGSLGERRECCLIDGKENRMQAQTIMSGDETGV